MAHKTRWTHRKRRNVTKSPGRKKIKKPEGSRKNAIVSYVDQILGGKLEDQASGADEQMAGEEQVEENGNEQNGNDSCEPHSPRSLLAPPENLDRILENGLEAENLETTGEDAVGSAEVTAENPEITEEMVEESGSEYDLPAEYLEADEMAERAANGMDLDFSDGSDQIESDDWNERLALEQNGVATPAFHPFIRPRTRERAPSPEPAVEREPTPIPYQNDDLSENTFPLKYPSSYSDLIPGLDGKELDTRSSGSERSSDNFHNRRLKNIDLSCYINSILQALSACRPFSQNVVDFLQKEGWEISEAKYITVEEKDKDEFVQYRRILKIILHIIVRLAFSQFPEFESIIPVKRHRVAPKSLRKIRESMICEGFENNTHQDAQEVFGNLRTFFEDSFKYFQEALNRVYDPSRMMQTNIESIRFCETCHKYWPGDKIVDIRINIPATHSSISTCLEHWAWPKVEAERTCSSCGERSVCTMNRIPEMPEMLIITANRLVSKNGELQKITLQLEPSMKIDLSSYMNYAIDLPNEYTYCGTEPLRNVNEKVDAVPEYELRSVVVHEGPTPEEGHYIAYTKNDDGSWLYCSDDKIKLAKEATMEANMAKNGYMFFYTPVTVKPQDNNC